MTTYDVKLANDVEGPAEGWVPGCVLMFRILKGVFPREGPFLSLVAR